MFKIDDPADSEFKIGIKVGATYNTQSPAFDGMITNMKYSKKEKRFNKLIARDVIDLEVDKEEKKFEEAEQDLAEGQIRLIDCKQSSTWLHGYYEGVKNNAQKANNGVHDFEADKYNFSATGQGIGEWWQATFDGKAKKVSSVKILSRKDQCGERLANSRIRISGQKFGHLPVETKSGEWYEIKPKAPMSGTNIRVETTDDTHLELACV